MLSSHHSDDQGQDRSYAVCSPPLETVLTSYPPAVGADDPWRHDHRRDDNAGGGVQDGLAQMSPLLEMEPMCPSPRLDIR